MRRSWAAKQRGAQLEVLANREVRDAAVSPLQEPLPLGFQARTFSLLFRRNAAVDDAVHVGVLPTERGRGLCVRVGLGSSGILGVLRVPVKMRMSFDAAPSCLLHRM
jgi:hypothetical protein